MATPIPPGLLELFAQLDAINPDHADGGGDHDQPADDEDPRPVGREGVDDTADEARRPRRSSGTVGWLGLG